MLRCFVMTPIALILLGAAPAPKPPKPPEQTETEKETANLQGTWNGVSKEVLSGKGNAGDFALIFDNGNFTFKRGKRVVMKGTFTIDPSKDPKTMDLTITEAQDKSDEGKVALCVYDLDKDALKWCLKEPGYDTVSKGQFSGRPKALAAKHIGEIYFTFKKGKQP